jgi:hypothetical protein
MRWEAKSRSVVHRRVILIGEVLMLLGLVGWLSLAPRPGQVNTLAAVLYHLLPFVAMWFLGRLMAGARTLVVRAVQSGGC